MLGVGFIAMVHEEIFVEGAVVMEVVTSRVRAAVEGQIAMSGAFLADVLVTSMAIVGRKAEAHRRGDVGSMFLMTCDALARVEQRNAVGVARIRELRAGV